MGGPRKYGTTGLFPSHRRTRKPKDRTATTLKEARAEIGMIGPVNHHDGGSCCSACRRYLDERYRQSCQDPTRQHILAGCCEWCGRLPLDMELIQYGTIATARAHPEILQDFAPAMEDVS
jgi:hypothetical protein